MKDKRDIRFWLSTFYNKEVRTQYEYKELKEEIERIGCCYIKDTIKVYNPELAFIFCSDRLTARNMESQEDTTINRLEYIHTYITAYKEGEKKFDTEFAVSPNTLYGANVDQYVKDIQYNYFQVPISEFEKGWYFVKNQYPTILTHEVIHKYGYYSGLVSSVEKVIEKYPSTFENFMDNEHSKTNGYCTSQEFKTDISQLCEKCPLNFYLKGALNLVEFQANEQMTILTKEQFNEQLGNQIKNALKAMQDVFLKEERHKGRKNIDNRISRIKIYLFNKERIKVLNKFKQNQELPPQQANRSKPELPEKSILFNSPETIEKLFTELKGYFSEKESELRKALNGEKLEESLLFPHNQNKFVEVFVRAKYNGLLLSTATEINNWLCTNFSFRYKRGKKIEVRGFNQQTVGDILKKPEKEPTRKERICINESFLPYIPPTQR